MSSVLFLGATGYIGSAVFNAFINAHPALEYTALVRTPAHAAHIRAVNTVIGTLEDRGRLVQLASKADVIVNVARADDPGVAEALIEGLKQRREEKEDVPALIHTCGGDVFEGKEIWDDMDGECVRALLSRPMEKAILGAEKQGVLRAYFIVPTAVYGLNPYNKPCPFYLDSIRELLSLPKPLNSSSSFPALTSVALKENPDRVMGMVNVRDLAALYLLVLDDILHSASPSPSETEFPRVYIASASEHLCISISDRVRQALVTRGLLSQISPTSSSEEKLQAITLEPHFFARRASTELGWTPTHPEWEHEAEWDIDRALEVLKISHPGAESAKNL